MSTQPGKTPFNPNAASTADAGIFGVPTSYKDAKIVYLPVPWEATTSYGGGTSNGPKAILEASAQIDLFDIDIEKPYECGLYMLEESEQVRNWNKDARNHAEKIIDVGGMIDGNADLQKSLDTVNAYSEKLNDFVHTECKKIIRDGKIIGLVGGDHSTPFGAFKAIAESVSDFGILHLDAHSDTRNAYEGFVHSHASIMFNALTQIPQITKLVQVGIRDFCEEEFDFIQSQPKRIKTHFDSGLQLRKMNGESWTKIADTIVADLPQNVWISFDIDGLDPRFCPNTGTPVPGGLDYQEALHLFRALVKSGRKIIGFDLNEVAPSADETDEWDANVGMRILYKLSGWTLASQKLTQTRG